MQEWMVTTAQIWMFTAMWVGGLAIIFGVLVRLAPCNRGMYWWTDLRAVVTDFMYWFVMPLGIRILRAKMLLFGIVLFFHGHEPAVLPVKDEPIWLQVTLMLVIQEVIVYWIHRVFHVGWAWRIHAIHHSPKVVDWMSTARFHPINSLLEFGVADTAVLLLGFSQDAFTCLLIFNLLYSAMVHANLNWTFGPLRYVLASPVFHRWHHTTEEAGLNKNFASTFPLLDLIFGTFYMPAGQLPEHYGTGDQELPEGFWAQCLYPFRRTQPAKAIQVARPEIERPKPSERHKRKRESRIPVSQA